MNYHTDEWIMKQLEGHHSIAIDKYGYDKVLGTFLYGSQNYQMDKETSDIDSITLVVPDIENIMSQAKGAEDTIRLGDGDDEIVFIFDIRYFIDGLAKSVLSYIEMLYTKYSIINPMYQNDWQKFIAKREEITKMNPKAFGQRVQEQINRELMYLTTPPEGSKYVEIVKRKGYVPKFLYHITRLEYFLNTYLSDREYGTLYEEPLPEICGRAKDGAFTLAEARCLEDESVARMRAAIRTLPSGRDELAYDFIKVWEKNIIRKGKQ